MIPVSFIEIRDMTTGKAVTDTQEAVQRAGVPKVEEWKKMAADYKNGSIPPPWDLLWRAVSPLPSGLGVRPPPRRFGKLRTG